jgi:hypothetical protein
MAFAAAVVRWNKTVTSHAADARSGNSGVTLAVSEYSVGHRLRLAGVLPVNAPRISSCWN